MTDEMPVYVKIDDYKEVLEVMNGLQSKINSAKDLLAHIEEVKSEEEAELDNWKIGLADVEEKLAALNSVLSQR